MSYNTRPGKAGEATAKAILEMVHLMYQNTTALRFLTGLTETLLEDLRKRTEVPIR